MPSPDGITEEAMKTNWTSVLRSGKVHGYARVLRPTGAGKKQPVRRSKAEHVCLGRADMLALLARLK